MKAILRPIETPFPTEIEDIFKRYPQGRDGYILKLFRVFANSLRFLTGKGALNLLDRDGPLPIREREIVILRVTANTNCEYEWGVHVAAFAHAAALTNEEVEATRLGSSAAACWSSKERVLVECIDQLCRRAIIADAAYAQFQALWSLEQQLEILALCGNYHLISFVANTSRIELEDFATSFPTAVNQPK